MNEYHVFFKRINAERFFFVAQMIDLKKMMDKKFDLLDRFRAEAEKQSSPITLSMGIAYGARSLDEIGGEAQNNLDVALVRGRDQEKYVFSDCAINVNPNAQELAEIAVESAKTAELFDIDPKVALMSFSTKGSAKAPEVDKVVEATKIAKKLAPQYTIDGELQFDASYVPGVAQLKAPNSEVAGQATVFVFPELQSGNIGYKIAQRFGNFEAIGPILQGLNKPVSDLSRGANEEDVYKLAIITAAQTLLD